eukprot:gene18513-biopygen6924
MTTRVGLSALSVIPSAHQLPAAPLPAGKKIFRERVVRTTSRPRPRTGGVSGGPRATTHPLGSEWVHNHVPPPVPYGPPCQVPPSPTPRRYAWSGGWEEGWRGARGRVGNFGILRCGSRRANPRLPPRVRPHAARGPGACTGRMGAKVGPESLVLVIRRGSRLGLAIVLFKKRICRSNSPNLTRFGSSWVGECENRAPLKRGSWDIC